MSVIPFWTLLNSASVKSLLGPLLSAWQRNSSLQRTRLHCSRVQWRRALHHSSWRMALHMLIIRLCVAAQSWKPIPWLSQQTVILLTLLPKAVWNSVVSLATNNRWSLHTTRFSGPVLWACVAYHFTAEPLLLLDVSTFTITALTVDRGSCSRADIWPSDWLERWHPMTVPHWKSLSSSVRTFIFLFYFTFI
jgi:hypothetical protein